jgi:hypothetical protein
MTIRAKFRCNKITAEEQTIWNNSQGQGSYDRMLIHTVEMVPVSADSDPEHENSKFWDATPTGKLEIGCVPEETVRELKIGQEYYLDITLAPAPVEASEG